MGDPAWTEYEINLIRDTIVDYREADKQDQSAMNALIKVLMHRNAKDVRRKFNEIKKDIDYGGTTITHDITDDIVVDMISRVDEAISYLEGLQEELHRLRQSELDLGKILEAVGKIK